MVRKRTMLRLVAAVVCLAVVVGALYVWDLAVERSRAAGTARELRVFARAGGLYSTRYTAAPKPPLASALGQLEKDADCARMLYGQCRALVAAHTDHWGNPLQYRIITAESRRWGQIRSLGADGVEDGEAGRRPDDIVERFPVPPE